MTIIVAGEKLGAPNILADTSKFGYLSKFTVLMADPIGKILFLRIENLQFRAFP